MMLAGCQFGDDKDIKSIEVDLSELPEEVTVASFDIELIKLKVIRYDLSETFFYISESMISPTDLIKLSTAGEHTISLQYEGFQTQFTINLLEAPLEYVTVTFLNRDGQTFGAVIIIKGTSATPPQPPIVEDYDFVGWSQSLENIQSDTAIQAIYEIQTVTISFYVDDLLWQEMEIDKGETLTDLPQPPYKEGFFGIWDADYFTNIREDMVVNAVYTEADMEALNQIIQQLDLLYQNMHVSSDITLVTTINQAQIQWDSSNEMLLSSDGVYQRPYLQTSIIMTASIHFYNLLETREYPFMLQGYRSLTQGIASGYVYRSYNALSNEFFDTMDVIFCAFVLIDAQGGFTGQTITGSSVRSTNSTYLNYMRSYVIPKSQEKGIYAIASLGGGGSVQRDTYLHIAASDSLRKAFAANAVTLINEYGFDGVDVDWETPTALEKTNFTLLMNELYTAVKANNPNHLVTAAITGGMWQPPRYDLENSIQYLDYVNVMTYGMSSSNGDYQNALYRSTSYNNPTLKVGKTLNSCSIDESVVIFNNLNVPSNKLIFGLAFYGMKQTYANGIWSSAGSVFYTSIKNTLLTSGQYQYVYDEIAQVPYLISHDGLTFVSYDDARSIIAKCEYVLDRQLAGVMYWENGCDLTGDLVHAINQGLKQSTSS